MTSTRTVFQRCVVVPDVHQANAHRAKVLQRPSAPVDVLGSHGILQDSHGQRVDPVDCQVAKTWTS